MGIPSLDLELIVNVDTDLLTALDLIVGDIYLSCIIVSFCCFLGPGLPCWLVVYFAALNELEPPLFFLFGDSNRFAC